MSDATTNLTEVYVIECKKLTIYLFSNIICMFNLLRKRLLRGREIGLRLCIYMFGVHRSHVIFNLYNE